MRKFTPGEFKVLLALIMAKKPLMLDDIIEHCYPDPDVEAEYSRWITKQFIYRLRRKGVRINNRYGIGYTLVRQGRVKAWISKN